MIAGPKKWPDLTEPSAETQQRKASEFVDAQVALAPTRRLMSSLRELMRSEGDSEAKLGRIVALLAAELRADDCSCYVLRAGEVLELHSSSADPAALPHQITASPHSITALPHQITAAPSQIPAASNQIPAAPHQIPAAPQRAASLRVGEGEVGDVAATAAPVLSVNPEAGALDYKSFCGVPILRGGRVRGVLAIRNRLPRAYAEETVDILQTVSLVLAEIIVAGGLITRLEINSSFSSGGKPTHMEGVSLSRGLAIGTAVLYEPALALQDILIDDPQAQKTRLSKALSSMHNAIDRMLNRNVGLHGTESRDILEAYQMFARDRGWLSRIEATIEKGLSAEAAVQRVQNETRARMSRMTDAYIRERLQDLEDLSNRLLSHLLKQGRAKQAVETLPEAIILVARSLGPAALLDFDHRRLKGVILEKGSHSNHVAIVARALGVPVVGQCGDILNSITPGDQVIVDGDHGMIYIGPADEVVDLYTKSMEARAKRTTIYRRHAQLPPVTKDGIRVSVLMNAGLMSEIDAVQASGAEGVGLFRTELSFMGLQKYPLVVTQAALYGQILDKMGDKPIVFRTLDIGGDKPLPYFRAPDEENPALGWRAVRIGMDRPAVLRTQFRAFIRGARGRNIKIMLPFVTEAAEFDRAKKLLEMEQTRAKAAGMPVPEKIELGVMLEVPALLWQLGTLLPSVSFVSVGTNDLMQYLFAADRGTLALRNRYDALSPAMLRVLKSIADQCRAARVPVSVCGEMAGQPLEAMVLIALGFQALSAPAQAVGAVKMMVPTLDTRQLVPYLDHLMESREHSLRERLLSFARDHNVNITQAV